MRTKCKTSGALRGSRAFSGDRAGEGAGVFSVESGIVVPMVVAGADWPGRESMILSGSKLIWAMRSDMLVSVGLGRHVTAECCALICENGVKRERPDSAAAGSAGAESRVSGACEPVIKFRWLVRYDGSRIIPGNMRGLFFSFDGRLD